MSGDSHQVHHGQASHQVHHGQAYMTEEEANKMIKKYDKNGDAILTKDELTALILEQASHRGVDKDHVVSKPKKVPAKTAPPKLKFTRSQIREIFLEHDIDGDGYLNVSELTKAFGFLGSILPFYKAHYGLAYADADGDGFIDEEELGKLIDYVEKVNIKKGGFH